MLTKEACEKIAMKAFTEEIEKNAGAITAVLEGLSRLGEALKSFKFGAKWKSFADEALDVYGKTGKSGLASHLESYRTPRFSKSPTSKIIRQENLPVHANAGFVQRELADSIHAFRDMKKGVEPGMSFGQGTGKIISNIGKGIVDDFKNARFKTMKPGEVNLFKKGWKNKIVVDSKGRKFLETSPFLGKRRILGYAKNGDVIIRKRLPMQGLAMTMTPAGFAATTLIGGGTAYDSGKDFLKYKLFPGPAIATDLGGMAIDAVS